MKYAAMFPGQGCQYKNMCAQLYQEDHDFRGILQDASEILGYDLWKMIAESKMSEFTKSEFAQPAVATVSYALYRNLLAQTDSLPAVGIGHSLGEISALICAESISFEAGLRFIQARGKLMSEILQAKTGFCGILTDLTQTQAEALTETVRKTAYAAITGYNSAKQFMVGGEKQAETILDDLADAAGGQYIPYRMVPMKANAPYHSALIQPYQNRLQELLADVDVQQPVFPIISTVSGKQIEQAGEIKTLLTEQLVKPVLWNQAVEQALLCAPELFADIGPNKIMKNLVLETDPSMQALAWDSAEDQPTIQQFFRKQEVS